MHPLVLAEGETGLFSTRAVSLLGLCPYPPRHRGTMCTRASRHRGRVVGRFAGSSSRRASRLQSLHCSGIEGRPDHSVISCERRRGARSHHRPAGGSGRADAVPRAGGDAAHPSRTAAAWLCTEREEEAQSGATEWVAPNAPKKVSIHAHRVRRRVPSRSDSRLKHWWEVASTALPGTVADAGAVTSRARAEPTH
jgi:hypothetical protein